MTPYPPPLDRLLTLGQPAPGADWADYRALGLSAEHVADLLRIVADDVPRGPDRSEEVWAPVHAWRALGQLGAEEAWEPLRDHLAETGAVDEWLAGDFGLLAALFGPSTLPSLASLVADASVGEHPRVVAAEAIAEVGQVHPAARGESIRLLVEQLDRDGPDDAELNGFVVGSLLDLEAREALPAIGRAFAEERVAIGVAGDWEDVQVELGVLERRLTPRRKYHSLFSRLGVAQGPPSARKRDEKREKNRRKAAKASKRRNRRK